MSSLVLAVPAHVRVAERREVKVGLLLSLYRVVQLNFTPEIEVFSMLFERYLTIFGMACLKQHMEYSRYRLVRYRIRREIGYNLVITRFVCMYVCLWKIV